MKVSQICLQIYLFACLSEQALGNPLSHPYVPFRTVPIDENFSKKQVGQDAGSATRTKSNVREYNPITQAEDPKCPLQFSLGVTQKPHSAGRPGSLAIVEPPLIQPILPSRGPGRQVLVSTHYEHVHLFTPAKEGALGTTAASNSVKETLVSQPDFPLLFESSAFLGSPVLGDVNQDGITDAIVVDYDGGIFSFGLQLDANGRRYFHKAQVPRLLVRRQWLESRLNETLPPEEQHIEEVSPKNETEEDEVPQDKHPYAHDKPDDPYHSFFEYSYGTGAANKEDKLEGVPADLLGQVHEDIQGLEERRKRRHHSGDGASKEDLSADAEAAAGENTNLDEGVDVSDHRRLQEETQETQQATQDQPATTQDSENREDGEQPIDAQQQPLENQNAERPIEINNVEAAAENGGEVIPDQPLESNPSENQGEPERMAEIQNSENVENTAGNQAEGNEAIDEAAAEQTGNASEHNEGGSSADEEGVIDDYVMYHDDKFEVVAGGDEDAAGDDNAEEGEMEDNNSFYGDDATGSGDGDDVPPYDDYRSYDDYYGRYDTEHEDYYNEKHYVRLPPHVLCSPVLAEAPKLYGKDGEMEDLLFVAVSYYLDEDEYQGYFSYKRFEGATDFGDESEVQRGMYVSSAIMVYQYGDSPRWGRQEHLDLSADHSAPVNTTLVGSFPLLEDNTRKGAFALSSPTIADFDGDGTLEVLLGTSMGFLYVLNARHLYIKDKWPIQFQYGIESPIVVEDVIDDTNLEIFVADVGGNVFCLSHDTTKIWHRDLVESTVGRHSNDFMVRASSPMVLGDVDGDGIIDVVLVLRIKAPAQAEADYIFALTATTGRDVPGFPIRVWGDAKETKEAELGDQSVHQKLPAPLLVDLHADQDFIKDYLHRNGNRWTKRPRQSGDVPQHGGDAAGLHIVQPIGSNLIVIEAGSGCAQSISIGEEVLAMVQVDDVHGTNSLDLVITTASGNIVTLESKAPFHPLNTWNHGERRGRANGFSHGYSASQGIFVHDVSRRYRDIFGVYVPVTFEIFDNRPNIQEEPERRQYRVEVRHGLASNRVLFRNEYNATGVYTERLYIPHGPGYYVLTAMLRSTHGMVYEDSFHLGYNVHYMDGFGVLLWLPLVMASICIFLCGTKKTHWTDDDYEGDDKNGILGGSALPE